MPRSRHSGSSARTTSTGVSNKDQRSIRVVSSSAAGVKEWPPSMGPYLTMQIRPPWSCMLTMAVTVSPRCATEEAHAALDEARAADNLAGVGAHPWWARAKGDSVVVGGSEEGGHSRNIWQFEGIDLLVGQLDIECSDGVG